MEGRQCEVFHVSMCR